MLETILDTLSDAGLEARTYRGRFMRRDRSCVAVVLDEIVDLTLLGPELRRGIRLDNFAEQFIVYWPEVLVVDDHPLRARIREQSEAEHNDDEMGRHGG